MSAQLAVLMPVFNERATIDEILRRVIAAPYTKQIVVVDDGSTDGTRDLLAKWDRRDGVEVHLHARNRGKGAAVRTALEYATAPFTIVQDADLEYDPAEYPRLIEPLMIGRARVVYGSRYTNISNVLPWTRFRLGVHVLNSLVRVLYAARLTDEATCYKAFDTSLLKSLKLRCERFEFCPEVTAKLLKRGHRILEVPISFHYRTVAQGKKIGMKDGIEAIWTLLKFRVLA